MGIKDRLSKLESKHGKHRRGLVIFIRGDSDYEEKVKAEYARLGWTPEPDDKIICFRRVDARKQKHETPIE